ncbi:hypothetical protein I5168_12100 [Nonlabens sp. SCSIO 43208]|uniref:hypothetical protein n=1 Tax=Nonlabens sp. SCSIO 43208 TaxID=2793009 RepID=UPI003D6B6BED
MIDVIIGEPLPVAVAKSVTRMLTMIERKELCEAHGYKKWTIQSILKCEQNVTSNNKQLVIDAIKLSVENAKNHIDMVDSLPAQYQEEFKLTELSKDGKY